MGHLIFLSLIFNVLFLNQPASTYSPLQLIRLLLRFKEVNSIKQGGGQGGIKIFKAVIFVFKKKIQVFN